MSARTLIVLALAIVCGGSSAAGVYLLRQDQTGPAVVETVTIVVAAREISRGEIVNEQHLTTREWPSGYQPPNAITDLAEVVNRTAMVSILAGEPVLTGKIAEAGAGRGLAALIPEGHRAYTIQTSRVGSNVAGFVLPGNRVDVLLTMRGGPQDDTGGGSSTTLLQAVEILAVDQRLNAPTDHKVDPKLMRSVTLLVTPKQASLLDLGHNTGTLALSLRNPGDLAEAETSPATVNVLRFTQQHPMFAKGKSSGVPNGLLASASKEEILASLNSPTANADSRVHTAKPVISVAKKKRPSYLQTYTLRGRHSGRVLMDPRQR